MAPKRRGRPRKADKPADEKTEDHQAVAPSEAADDAAEEAVVDEKQAVTEPSPKKAKVEEKKKRGRQPKAALKKGAASAKKPADDEAKAEEEEEEEAEEGVEEEAPAKCEKVVIIEASKECNCFKTGAAKVQTGLTKAIPGIEVLINPEKPRKGCFEVRSKDGDIYLSMLGLPRPFTKLKTLDMDKAVEEVVAKLK